MPRYEGSRVSKESTGRIGTSVFGGQADFNSMRQPGCTIFSKKSYSAEKEQDKYQYIYIHIYNIKDKYDENTITIEYVTSDQNAADILLKY